MDMACSRHVGGPFFALAARCPIIPIITFFIHENFWRKGQTPYYTHYWQILYTRIFNQNGEGPIIPIFRKSYT